MLKRFEMLSKGKKVELEILEKISENTVMVNVTTNGIEIKNAKANICQINGKPNKLFLQVNLNNDSVYLQIADRNSSYKMVADWFWTNIQDSNSQANAYVFTSHVSY